MEKMVDIETDITKIEVGKCIAYKILIGRFSYYIKSTFDIYPCKIGMMIKLATKEARVNSCFAIAEKNENNIYTLSFYHVQKNEDKVKIAQKIDTERMPYFLRRYSESEKSILDGISKGIEKIL